MIGVYTIVHTQSRKFYVGSSIDVKKRLITHKSKLRNNRHHCNYLQNAVNKYGIDSFQFIVQSEAKTESEAREIEQAVLDAFFSDTYNSKNTALGASVGELNPMKRPEIAKKVSEKRKGMVFTAAHIARLSEVRKGKPTGRKGYKASDETRLKMRLARLGKPSPKKGVVLSAEQRERLSKARTGVKIGKYSTIICKHCGKVGAGGAMSRWHGDNCKLKGL